jgi:hypothetical protein
VLVDRCSAANPCAFAANGYAAEPQARPQCHYVIGKRSRFWSCSRYLLLRACRFELRRTTSYSPSFPEFSGQPGLSLRETRVCRGSKVSSRCLRSLSRSFCGVLASVELLKNGGGFTTLSKVPVPSGSCEEIGRRIKVATVVEMVQPLDCKREPITRSSTPGID